METSPTRAPGLSVVIPAYRSPGTLEQLCIELEAEVEQLVDDFEVVIVDDGSGDDTWATIRGLADRFPWVRGLSLLRNYGQHNALLAGLRASRLPLVVTMDDDLQNPPSAVPVLLAALSEDLDLVYGRPRQEPQGPARNAASRITKRAMALALGSDVYPRSSAFRLFRRELITAADSVRDPNISIDVLLSWGTRRIADVEVDFAERTSGRSGYTVRKLVRHALNMITGYSTRPLRWLSLIGLACATLGFAMLVYILARYIFGDVDVAGFTFLAGAITLFSGVQLLSLGVLGEYIGRMHFRSMGRPPYIVRETHEHDPARSASVERSEPQHTDEHAGASTRPPVDQPTAGPAEHDQTV